MTPAGPPDPVLSAWHRRFPDRQHLWVGSLRLWYADLGVREPGPASRLGKWVARAAALGPGDPAGAARRLGLPEAVAAPGRAVRRAFAFLDLPHGPVAVPVPAGVLPAWPESVTANGVPGAVVHPAGVEVAPLSADWRTVPVVRAGRLNAVAVGLADGIEVYAASADWATAESPTWTLEPGTIPPATPDAWTAAWREWCRGHGVGGVRGVRVEKGVAKVVGAPEFAAGAWLVAGDGPLKEAAVVQA
jgi:hypothetical protein